MKAVRIHQFGGPEVIKLEDLPRPQIAPDEVLVRVRASSVNPVDYKIRQGGYLPVDALPIILGRDVAGVIEQAGAEVSAFTVGEGVYALLGRDRGGHAQYVAVKAVDCALKPERLDFVAAAAVPLAGLTAWQGLFDQGGLVAGQRVLIHGAAGGVGHFAVQFARARGAEVFATCSEADRDLVRGLGAAVVIDYQHERFEDRVEQVDLVFDLIGGETQARSWSVLKAGGVLVSTLKQPDPGLAAAARATGKHYMAQPNGAQLTEIAGLIDQQKVTPHITRVYPLEQAALAEAALEHDHLVGKVVLSVAEA